MVRTQISLTDEQYLAVKQVASERGMSFSAVIRETVDRLVVMSRRSAWDGLLDLAGRYDSGRTDVSERHDHYLWADDE